MRDLADAVAKTHGLTLADIMTDTRRDRRVISRCRQDVMLALREAGYWSFPQIGRFLKRDHSSVIYGVRQAGLRRLRAQQEAA